jgi:hypothetical protein
MKQFSLLIIFLVLAHAVLPQNVGIGEPNPTVKLTVKAESFQPSFLVKNGDDDSLLFTGYRNLFLGGYHPTGTGVVNVSNKNFLPFDPPIVNLIAAGERSGGNANGSIANLRFSNVNTNKYFELSSYAGAEMANQYFGLGHRDPDDATQFRYLMYMKVTGQTGFGTFTPTGRMQINHRASTITPTLNLVDSASAGPIIELGTTVASDFWQIRANITQSSPAATYLEFSTQTAPRMFLRGDGHLGLGTFPTEKLDMIGNARINGEINRPSTGAANLVPVAYGTISATGAIQSGSGNFTVDHLSTGLYIITITGESYLFSQYTTTATGIGSTTPLLVNTGSGSGSLQVRVYNLSGVATDGIFTFVVYKP